MANSKLVFLALLGIINLVTTLVVVRNYNVGLYPADADSIGLPIISTWILSLLAVPYLVLLAYVPRLPFVRKLAHKGIGIAALIGAAFCALYLPGIVVSGAMAAYWFFPNHYLLSLSFGTMTVAVVAFCSMDLRTLRRSEGNV